MNALDLYQAGKLRVACAVSHYNETTLQVCLDSIAKMKANFVEVKVISGKSPTNASFNAALDFAQEVGADVLFHTAADVIVKPEALIELLKVMDIDENYSAIAKGYDSIFGDGRAVGIWILNMKIIGDKFRFNNVFKMDLDFCEGIEASTGKSRTYTSKKQILGYHHLIWTPEELFMKYRYSYPKYNEVQKARMMNFLETGLKENPGNKTILAGFKGVEIANQVGLVNGAKDNSSLSNEFDDFASELNLNGTEVFIDKIWSELNLTPTFQQKENSIRFSIFEKIKALLKTK